MSARPAGLTGPEQPRLVGVGGGHGDAYRRLVEPHRRELNAHCYRMLGSLHDAEDALQEALVRAWRALPEFNGPRLVRPWLYKIATNVCLDAIAARNRRALPIDLGPPIDAHADPGDPITAPVWIEPCPDELLGFAGDRAMPEARYEQREAVELAFIAALQRLPARQRSALILRDVLGFSARDVARFHGTSVPSANSALQRARTTIDERLPDRSQQATLRSLGDIRIRQLVERFVEALQSGDIDTILATLTADAKFAMPPYAAWYQGRHALADSWLMPCEAPTGLYYIPTRANGQLALGAYHLDREARCYVAIALDVLTLRGAQVAEITAFRTPEILRWFGLPDRIPAQQPGNGQR